MPCPYIVSVLEQMAVESMKGKRVARQYRETHSLIEGASEKGEGTCQSMLK